MILLKMPAKNYTEKYLGRYTGLASLVPILKKRHALMGPDTLARWASVLFDTAE